MSGGSDAALRVVLRLLERGPRSTAELLDALPLWRDAARGVRRDRLLRVLDAAEREGLVASRYETRPLITRGRSAGAARHRVFEVAA